MLQAQREIHQRFDSDCRRCARSSRPKTPVLTSVLPHKSFVFLTDRHGGVGTTQSVHEKKPGSIEIHEHLRGIAPSTRVPEPRFAYYRRCQRFRKNGEQCKAPALKGGEVCYQHAAMVE